MTSWNEYAPGSLPSDVYYGNEVIPVPVEVKFDDGNVREDWIVGGELFLYCQKSFAYMTSAPAPIAWRYQYEPDDFMKKVKEQREGVKA